MNNNSQMPIGDLATEQNELTVPTEEMVTRRAREIALIEERNPDEFTKWSMRIGIHAPDGIQDRSWE